MSQESRDLAKLLKLADAHPYPAHIEKFRQTPGLWGHSGHLWDISVPAFQGNSRIACISTARDVLVESSESFFALGSAQLKLERVQCAAREDAHSNIHGFYVVVLRMILLQHLLCFVLCASGGHLVRVRHWLVLLARTGSYY